MPFRARFAQNIRSRKVVASTFVKSNDPSIIEVLGHSGFDFAILDAEHAALDRADVARMAMASRAARLPLIVRVPEPTGAWISTVLDAGCAGLMIPQVSDAEAAVELVGRMRYGVDGMGFSPSTPGADFGTRGIARHLAQQPDETVLICQIEDPVAVERASEIAAIEGVDGLLVGPVDLAVSKGLTDPALAEIADMCRHVISAGKVAGKAAGLFLSDLSKAAAWEANGATLFVLGSDQAFLMGAAREALDFFRNAR